MLIAGCARHDAQSGGVQGNRARSDVLEGAVTLPIDDSLEPAGAVRGSFRSIDWETTGGLVMLSWSWDGPPRTFVIYCGAQILPPTEGIATLSMSHALWQEKGPGIYHYKVVAEPASPEDEPQEIVCGPIVMGRIVWDYSEAARERCTHFAVYLRKVGESRPALCIYTAPLPEGPQDEYGVPLRRIFSSDAVQTRVAGERQFLFGETRSTNVAARINTVRNRPADTPVTDQEVWDYILLRKNSVTLTYCTLTNDGIPDGQFESAQSPPVWFTYSRALLYADE
jgi:hypothetical protein